MNQDFAAKLVRITSIVLSTSILVAPILAAEENDRPKIGIAFGGGGAKGGAHIGVLKVLEDLRIPVDYIAGTSMGAIMGGLYASGMSPEEMTESLFDVDWDDAMQDTTNRQDLSFRRKEDSQRYLLDLQLGISFKGLKWPGGLMTGQKLFFLLQSLTLPVSDVDDFANLPIPFRAVASDIQVGEPVVLVGGNLATAMRASMAIPTVFSPVVIDGKVLVDGGVTNNLPVDVVRAMGADIVIAIDLGAPLSSREVASMMQIQKQTMRMLTRKNMEPQLESADIVLHPDVAKYGTLNFAALPEIYQAGIDEAQAQIEALLHLGVSEEEYRRFQERHSVPADKSGVVDSIRIEGNERVDSRVIEGQISIKPGEELDFEILAEELGRIYGLGDFEQVSFSLEHPEGRNDLVIHIREKSWAPNYLHFGLNVSSDLDGSFETSLLINMTNTRLNSKGGEVRTDLLLGKPRLLTSELYQPLDFEGRWFASSTMHTGVTPTTFWEDVKAVATTDLQQLTGTLDIGYQLGTHAEFRLGVLRGRGSVKITSGSLPEEELSDIDFAGIRFLGRLDRLDEVEFPRDGTRGSLLAFASLDSLGADFEYEKVQGKWGEFWSWGPNTVLAGLEAGWASEETPFWDELAIGGMFSLGGFQDDSLRGNFYGVARFGYYREVWRNKFIGGWAEAGNMWASSSEADFSDLVYAGTLFGGARTRIGPIYVAWSRNSESKDEFYFNIGRTF